ncbi:MAG: TRAP transporter small permease [Proteobacteria bacterium]|nr:TRAP transporter small permease [Pseudomonadota bacterium]
MDAVLAVGCLSAMILIVLCQIVLRNMFNTGIEGADFLVRHLVLWVVFLGAGIATRQHMHIHIDLLPRWMPGKIKMVSELLVTVFSVAVLVILTYASFTFVKMEFDSGITLPLLELPIWVVEIIIPVGYGVIALHFIVNGFIRIYHKNKS